MTKQKVCKMESSTNLRYGNVWIHKLFETINQELKAQGTKYQVLSDSGICCKELGELKATSFRACMRSFCSVYFYKKLRCLTNTEPFLNYQILSSKTY